MPTVRSSSDLQRNIGEVDTLKGSNAGEVHGGDDVSEAVIEVKCMQYGRGKGTLRVLNMCIGSVHRVQGSACVIACETDV